MGGYQLFYNIYWLELDSGSNSQPAGNEERVVKTSEEVYETTKLQWLIG